MTRALVHRLLALIVLFVGTWKLGTAALALGTTLRGYAYLAGACFMAFAFGILLNWNNQNRKGNT